MKRSLLLTLISCWLYTISVAQPNKSPKPTPNPYETKLKTFTDQVLAVLNGKAPLSKLTGTQLPKASSGWFTYPAPALGFSGGLDTSLDMRIKWEGNTGKRSWRWNCTLLRFPKGTQTDKLKAELQLFSSAMAKLYPAAVKESTMRQNDAYESFTTSKFSLQFYASFLWPYDLPDYLQLSVYFTTPFPQTREQLTDSLRQQLDQSMAATPSAKEKIELIKSWSKTLEATGFDKPAVLAQGTQLFQQVASKDIKLAFGILMEWPNTDDLKTMTASLSSSQQEAIRQMSQAQLDEYYNRTAKEPAPVEKKPAPPVTQQKEETDPCKIEVAALTFKPGHWIYGEGRSAIVFNYNCGIHLYTIAWMNSYGNLQLEKDISPESLARRYRRAEGYQANKFIICKDCAGKGYGYGYDRASSYIGSLRIEYNTGDLVRKSCMYCGGKGCMKVN